MTQSVQSVTQIESSCIISTYTLFSLFYVQNSVNLVKISNIMSLFYMAILDAVRVRYHAPTVPTHEREIRVRESVCE